MVKIAAIGLGNRTRKYLGYIPAHPADVQLVAVAEPDAERRRQVAAQFALPEAVCFSDADALFRSGLDIDGVIIGSPDNWHYDQTMKAIACGWHVLLEKPVAGSEAECRALGEAAGRAGVQVCVCYVLRYHPYYVKLRELVRSGAVGEVMNVSHRVQVGTDRLTHTYVRGPWSVAAEASPSFLSKCCHDVDILLWITGKHIRKVASFGSLKLFRPENTPKGAAERCIDCPLEKDCAYSAVDLYLRRRDWISNFTIPEGSTQEEVIRRELREGRFGRCAWRCGNDVADHQTVLMEAEDGTVIDVVMNGFTRQDGRQTVISGSEGEIVADEHTIRLHRFASGEEQTFDYTSLFDSPLHGFADLTVMEDFVRVLSDPDYRTPSPIEEAVESHRVCYLAETARREDKISLL